MSNQDNTGQGPYIPKARKSIHNHRHCIFTESLSMGRYGLNNSDSRRQTSSRNQSYDEVDNVCSKFARSSSPLQVRQIRDKRRNSLSTLTDEQYSDDSESNLFSKSLPANLPSNYCSEEFIHHSLPTEFNNTDLSSSLNQSNSRLNGQDYSRNNTSVAQNAQQENQTKSTKKITVAISAIVICLVAIYTNSILEIDQLLHRNNGNNYDEFKFNKEMTDLGEKYKIDDHSILELQTGISTIFEKNDTGSFIFLYDSNSINFNYMRLGDFMDDVATAAARYLRNHSSSVIPTVVHSSHLDMRTHSELMNKYRGEVSKNGVMLLQDIDGVPSSLAMAFHYFCDEYNPLVAKTAIFFTLNLAKCSKTQAKASFHGDVEKCLSRKWSTLPEDNIKPLLARVVNVIVDVRGLS